MIEQWTQAKRMTSGVLYFFFKHYDADKGSPLAAVRALTHQLLHLRISGSEHAFLDQLAELMDRGGQARATNFRALWDEFCRHVSRLPPVIVILDALDECSAAAQLLPGLLSLARDGAARILVTSRREADLDAALKDMPSLHMGVEEVREDIRLYTEHTILHSAKLSDARVRSRIVRMLNARSKGMFLWVVLVIKELESIVSIAEIEEAIVSLPETLEGVYERIIRRLARTLNASRRVLCCKLLRWLTLATRALLLDEVNEALKLDYSSEPGSIFSPNLLLSDGELELICGSMATVRNRSIRLIHLTTHEYLQQDPTALQLGKELHAFFVNVGEENARITSLCTKYLSTLGDVQRQRDGEFDAQELRSALPFVEYASQNWLLHLVQSFPHALLHYELELEQFLRSRSPFFWIEHSMLLNPGSCALLQHRVKSLLDWLSSKWSQSSTEAAPRNKLRGLLDLWGQSYNRLLSDWENAIEQDPQFVHHIDPSTIFLSRDYGVLEHLEKTMAYETQAILHEVDNFVATTSVPQNRRLLSNSSRSHQVSFVVDKKRGILIALEKKVWRIPRLHCQDMATGHRLEPISDIECSDVEQYFNLETAVISADSQYVGVVYSCRNGRMDELYSSVWKISDSLDFQPNSKPVPWAQKVFSMSTSTLAVGSASQIIAIGKDGYVNCPTSRIKLLDGTEQALPFLWSEGNLLQFCFCSNGNMAAYYDRQLMTINIVEFEGGTESIKLELEDSSELIQLHASPTGRYILLRFATRDRFTCYDRHSRRMSTLVNHSIRYLGDPLFCFSSSESFAFGAWNYSDEIGRETATIYMWSIEGSSFTLQATHKRAGIISAAHLDDGDNILHIVSDGCKWSRLQFYDGKIHDLDDALVIQKYERVVHKVSRDGTQLAVLHLGRSR
jgi:hypothetical protein